MAPTNPKIDLETELRTQLKALLDGGQAHAKLDDAVNDMPFEKQDIVPDGLPYSAWQLLEHLRLPRRKGPHVRQHLTWVLFIATHPNSPSF